MVTPHYVRPGVNAVQLIPGTSGNLDGVYAMPITRDGFIVAIAVHADALAGDPLPDTPVKFSILLNQIETSLQVTIPPNSEGNYVATGSVPVKAGDLLSLLIDYSTLRNGARLPTVTTIEYVVAR